MSESAKNSVQDANLSRRLHHALTAGKEELFRTVRDSEPEVLRAALKNPALDENHLLALLERRDLGEELLQAIYRHGLTGESHNLKVALAHNPHTPGHTVLSLLPHLYLFELVTSVFSLG